MEESIRSRRENGAHSNLHKEKSDPQPSLQKEAVSPHLMLRNKKGVPLPQVSRGKRREPLCSRELLYLLVSRLLVIRRLKLLAKEERAVLYLILDKKLRASDNLMRQTRAPSQKKQTGLSNFTRNKRAPFTLQLARRDLLSL